MGLGLGHEDGSGRLGKGACRQHGRHCLTASLSLFLRATLFECDFPGVNPCVVKSGTAIDDSNSNENNTTGVGCFNDSTSGLFILPVHLLFSVEIKTFEQHGEPDSRLSSKLSRLDEKEAQRGSDYYCIYSLIRALQNCT